MSNRGADGFKIPHNDFVNQKKTYFRQSIQNRDREVNAVAQIEARRLRNLQYYSVFDYSIINFMKILSKNLGILSVTGSIYFFGS